MDRKLWTAIQELLDAADYALGPLDRHSDYEDDPFGVTMVPNAALSAHACLSEAAEQVAKLMPPDPITSMAEGRTNPHPASDAIQHDFDMGR